jgi:hypothetical protein
MKLIALALLLPVTNTALAEVSLQEAEDRTPKAEEVLVQESAIAVVAEREPTPQAPPPGPDPAKAYAELGHALTSHPRMADVNQAESEAAKAYRSAVAGGNPVEISFTQQDYARAKAARTQKALSIPELKLAIENWQQAVLDDQAAKREASETRAAMEAIQTKLKALSEVIVR